MLATDEENYDTVLAGAQRISTCFPLCSLCAYHRVLVDGGCSADESTGNLHHSLIPGEALRNWWLVL